MAQGGGACYYAHGVVGIATGAESLGYILLWLFMLGAALSWLAAALATASYIPIRWLRVAVRVVLSLFPTAAICGFVWLAWYARDRGYIHFADALVVYLMAALYIAGVVWMFTPRGRWWWWWGAMPGGKGAHAVRAKKADRAEDARAARAVGAVATAPTWDEAKDSKRSKPRQATAKTRAAFQGLRLRTVLALWGLTPICVGLHFLTLYILQGVATGIAEAQFQKLEPAGRADFEQLEAAIPVSAATTGGPVDGSSAYDQFYATGNSVVDTRRENMRVRLGLLDREVGSDHQAALTYKTKIPSDQATGTPEDSIEETLPQSLVRFRSDIEALRACTCVRPYIKGHTFERLMDPKDSMPIMKVQNAAFIFQIDGIGAIATGDWDQLRKDLATLQDTDHQLDDQGNAIGELLWIGCHATRLYLVQRMLGAPNLPQSALADWQPGAPEGAQIHLAKLLRLDACERLAEFKTDGLQLAGWQLNLKPSKGYYTWLAQAYVVADGAEDVVDQLSWMQARVAAPFFQTEPAWPACRYVNPGSPVVHPSACWYFTQQTMVKEAVRLDEMDDQVRVGRAARLYQFKYAQWPATLQALVPEFLPAVPVDRFDGKPLKMRNDATGMVIWSVGAENDNTIDALGPQPADDWYSNLILWLGSDYTAWDQAVRAQLK